METLHSLMSLKITDLSQQNVYFLCGVVAVGQILVLILNLTYRLTAKNGHESLVLNSLTDAVNSVNYGIYTSFFGKLIIFGYVCAHE